MSAQRIGPYLIERRLGSGGMAEVFLAQKPLGRGYKQVVVKRMLTELIDDDRFVDMFLREAGILAQLAHPNIVQIFDLGQTDDGQLYIAMEYLEGLSVRDLAVRAWRAHRALPCELVIRLVLEVARGLDYLHRHQGPRGEVLGLVHRDVTPDNIFFLKDGLVKLVDFGIARGAQTKLVTTKGELKGKVPFMAPELLDYVELDGRADLWSLGVTAYWLLAGHRPFRGKNEVQIMRAILQESPPLLNTINADVSPWLAALVAALLEKDRSKRVQRGADIEEVIMKHGGGRIDRAVDVEFVDELLDVPPSDLDDVTSPVPAVRRSPSVVFVPRAAPVSDVTFAAEHTAQVPQPITLEPVKPVAATTEQRPRPITMVAQAGAHAAHPGSRTADPFAGDTEVNAFVPPPGGDDSLFDELHHTPSERGFEIASAHFQDGVDAASDAFSSAAHAAIEAARRHADRPNPVGDDGDRFADEWAPPTTVDKAKSQVFARAPLPRAIKVDMPADELNERDQTQRLTESQVGIQRDRTGDDIEHDDD